jgi:anti-sigma B factor antagonist
LGVGPFGSLDRLVIELFSRNTEPSMDTQDSRLVVHQEDGITRVEFVDRNILEEASIQQIGEEISALIESSSNPKILLDFENVEHLSSAALGTLITINTKVRQKGGQLRLSNIDKQIYEVFVITKLNKLFQIHDTNAKAVKSFK